MPLPARPSSAEHSRVLEAAFASAFGRPLPPFGSLPADVTPSAEAHETYLRIVLFFARAVIEPLEDGGMTPRDRVIDIASGDGEMSLALALKGYRDVTLWDLDAARLGAARRRIEALVPEARAFTFRNDSATRLEGAWDVLISCQTLEHLSDRGNYSVASRDCQREFMRRIRACAPRLCYFNVPNYAYPVDGHDTGRLFFHYLPMRVREHLIRSGRVECSWAGIARPVSIAYFRRHLPEHRLASAYYAFASFDDYMRRRPPFDQMGFPFPPESIDDLSLRKRAIRVASRLLGRGTQLLLPTLSAIYRREA